MKRSRSGRAEPERPMADWCELALDGCLGRATDRHHRRRRGPRHGGTDGPENTMDLCSKCHHEGIHGNVERAFENGWLLHALPPSKSVLFTDL